MKGKPLDERIVGGAVVGAVTGGVLSSQGSDCAPAESPVEASFFGAILGAIRGAFGWDVSEDPAPQSDGNGASEAPFPFEGRECEAENSQ